MRRHVRNDAIVFTGNDAIEYRKVCDGVYRNDENRLAFEKYMAEHTTSRYDPATGDEYLDCDFINDDDIFDSN